MTGHTVGWKTERLVVGIIGTVVIVQMAGYTIRGRTRISAVRMTVGTLSHFVLAQQPKGCVRKFTIFPGVGTRSMANFTICGKTGRFMVRIIGTVVIVQVAGYTCSRQPNVLPVGVTIRAVGYLVNAFQDKSIMAKNSSFPTILIEMAKLTLRGESG
jgi:hypothetical protein